MKDQDIRKEIELRMNPKYGGATNDMVDYITFLLAQERKRMAEIIDKQQEKAINASEVAVLYHLKQKLTS